MMCNFNNKLRNTCKITHKNVKNNDNNVNMEEVSKTVVILECFKLFYSKLKIEFYKHSLVYVKHKVPPIKKI